MAVNLEHAVARMSGRLQNAATGVPAVAVNTGVTGSPPASPFVSALVKIKSRVCSSGSVRRKPQPLPQRLGAIIERFLAGVFRVFGFRRIRHGRTVAEPQVHVVLEEQNELAERHAAGRGDGRRRPGYDVLCPCRSARLDNQASNGSFIAVLDAVRRDQIGGPEFDRNAEACAEYSCSE